MRQFKNFESFFAYYKDIHKNPRVRTWHSIGQYLFFFGLGGFLVTRQTEFIAGGIAFGYFCAWGSHLWFDGQSPATWKHPLWSIRAGVKMWRER